MFAYVKFEDGYKMIVKTSDIKHFKAECVNRSKKYKVRWEDDTFYDALIIDIGGEYKMRRCFNLIYLHFKNKVCIILFNCSIQSQLD